MGIGFKCSDANIGCLRGWDGDGTGFSGVDMSVRGYMTGLWLIEVDRAFEEPMISRGGD